MKHGCFYNSLRVDHLFMWGWVMLAFVGQAMLPVQVQTLEWMAVAWVAVGLCVVRRSACLPLFILTCPLFLCAPPDEWSWATSLWALIFLSRVLYKSRLRNVAWVVFWGMLVFVFSWPRHSGSLLLELRHFSWKALLIQWIRPRASWAIFPFRHTCDRALMAALAAALIVVPGYVKTIRIWRAFFVAGLMAVGAAYATALLPWQQPHNFLGTTNFATLPGVPFPGAGHNPCYLAYVLATALPWFLVPLRSRHSWAHLGLLPLFIPTLFLGERVYLLALIAIGATFCMLAVFALASSTGRVRFAAHVRSCLRQYRIILTIGAGALLLAVLWCCHAGGIDHPSTPLNNGQGGPASGQSVWVKKDVFSKPVETRLAQVIAADTKQHHNDFLGRLEMKMAHYDAARTQLWFMGMRHAWHHGFWRGSGAGTWCRFNRAHRITRLYFEHMHNTFLNLIFEYGMVPMTLVYLLVACILARLLRGTTGVIRAWLLYFSGLSAIAMGYDLFYFPFSNYCLVLVSVVVLTQTALRAVKQDQGRAQVPQGPAGNPLQKQDRMVYVARCRSLSCGREQRAHGGTRVNIE